MLKHFHNIFGKNFSKNLGIIFTHWSYSNKDKFIREKANLTEEALTKRFNKILFELDIIKEYNEY
jgi:hypothetical protein